MRFGAFILGAYKLAGDVKAFRTYIPHPSIILEGSSLNTSFFGGRLRVFARTVPGGLRLQW